MVALGVLESRQLLRVMARRLVLHPLRQQVAQPRRHLLGGHRPALESIQQRGLLLALILSDLLQPCLSCRRHSLDDTDLVALGLLESGQKRPLDDFTSPSTKLLIATLHSVRPRRGCNLARSCAGASPSTPLARAILSPCACS